MLDYGNDCLKQAQRLGFPLQLFTGKDAGHSFFNDQPWRDLTLYESDKFLVKYGYLEGPPIVKPRPGKELYEVKKPLDPQDLPELKINSPQQQKANALQRETESPPQKAVPTPDESAAKRQQAAKKQQEDWAAKLKLPVETTNKLGIQLILIPPADAALPKPYYLGKYEVTQRQWEQVMGYNPSQFNPQHEKLRGMDTSLFPVERV